MAQPLNRNSAYSRIKSNRSDIHTEQRKPNLPGPYVYVGDFVGPNDPGNDPPPTTIDSPAWKNSFTWVGTRYVGFRHGLDGDPEFIGQLDLTQGAVTGTVAFTLPSHWCAVSFDFTFPIYTGGTDWINGIFSVDATSGDCTVYWPVQATPI